MPVYLTPFTVKIKLMAELAFIVHKHIGINCYYYSLNVPTV